MYQLQSSLTVLGVVFAGAIENEKHAVERIYYDLIARQFVPARVYRLLEFFIKSGYAGLGGSGENGFLPAREPDIDDVQQNFRDGGLHLLTILGEDYHSRAHHFGLHASMRAIKSCPSISRAAIT